MLEALLWKREWGGQIILSHGESNSKGVAILIDSEININILDTKYDVDGRYTLLHCKLNDKILVILNNYCPPKINLNRIAKQL